MESDAERDERVLASRMKGRSFVKITTQLRFESTRDALAAYRRAVGRRPAKEQESIRATERKRLDAMTRAVRANAALTPADTEKRLARIEQLRATLG